MKEQYFKILGYIILVLLLSFCFSSIPVRAELGEGEHTFMEEKVQKIQGLFPAEEDKVVMDPEGNINITLSSLNFMFGKSSINPKYYSLLNNVYQAAQMFPNRKIRITGHTDSAGSTEYNKRLSLERAKAVKHYMEKELGIQTDRLEIIGAGESEPIASNTTPKGMMLNRRIEITFLSP